MYTLKASKFVELFQNLFNTEINQIIVHSFDVAKASAAIGRRVGIVDDPCSLYLAGLLHDVGFVLYANVVNMEAFRKMMKNVQVSDHGAVSFDIDSLLQNVDSRSEHAIVSYAMVRNVLPEKYSLAVLHHHTPYKELEKLVDEEIAKITCVIRTADTISNIYRRESREGEAKAVKELLETIEYAGIGFKEVKEAATDFIKDQIDFSMMTDTNPHIDHFTDRRTDLGLKEIEDFFKIFVYLVDFRSPFTRNHSTSIATLARDIAVEMLKSKFDASVMYIAGLVHDIGKLRTPLEILHKPGRLDPYEIVVMKRHIAHTIRLTYHMKEISEILQVAYMHHERLDGSGYPLGLKAPDIPMKARILQVVDVFVALTEDRPYRKGMDYEGALSVIEKEVKNGKLDPDVFSTLKEMVKNGYRLVLKSSAIEDIFKEGIDEGTIERILNRGDTSEEG